MITQTTLAESVDSANLTYKTDESCKKLISHKMVLAWIMKRTIPEYQPYSIQYIAKHFIVKEGTFISEIPVHQDAQTLPEIDNNIMGLNTEDNSVREGTITYDILFRAILPNSHPTEYLLIDIEIQKDYYPGYPLPKRGIYYCCRNISSQYGTIFANAHYEKLQKTCSIWLCTNPPLYCQNTHKKYTLQFESNCSPKEADNTYNNFLSVILLGLKPTITEDLNNQSIIDMLSVLLSPTMEKNKKKHILQEFFELPMTKEIEEDIEEMCNYGTGIAEMYAEIGLQRGIQQGISQALISLVKDGLLNPEEAAKRLNLSTADLQKMLNSQSC